MRLLRRANNEFRLHFIADEYHEAAAVYARQIEFHAVVLNNVVYCHFFTGIEAEHLRRRRIFDAGQR